MDCRLPIADCRLIRPPGRRGGFSFTEVLFAVMVMGIGFIMVAAMFPVTIRQQQSTQEETVSAAVARAALAFLQENDVIHRIANDSDNDRQKAWREGQVLSVSERKPNGQLKHDDAPAWDALAGNMILSENPRVAWVPLFRKADTQSGLAQVFIFVVQNRNREQYQTWIPDPANPTEPTRAIGSDVYRLQTSGGPTESDYATLEPKPVYVITIPANVVNPNDPEGPDHIVFVEPNDRPYSNVNPPLPDYREAAAEGGYVVIADVGPSASSYMNGRIYQIGRRVDTGNPRDFEFELVPGNDLIVTDKKITRDGSNATKDGAKAYIIGKALRDPTQPWDPTNNPFEGPAQDIAIYMSYIKLQQQE